MTKNEDDRLRDYGRQENQYVLASTFNPTAVLYGDLESVEETAQEACEQAERAFGPEDPIHIEALINLSLFYWKRRRDPLKAETSLVRAAEILSASSSNKEELLTELIAASALVETLKDLAHERLAVIDRIVNTVPRPFGISNQPQQKESVEIYRRMVEIAIDSDHPLLPYLVTEVGRPFALELASAGLRADAVDVLTNILPPLQLKVWEPDSYQTEMVALEARWLAGTGAEDIQLRRELERLAYDLEAATRDGVPAKVSSDLRAARSAFKDALLLVDQIVQAPVLERAPQITGVIDSFAAVLREFDLSKHSQSKKRAKLLVPTFTALACLHMARPQPGKAEHLEQALDYLNKALEILYSDPSFGDENAVDRTRVLLADVYSRRVHGDPEENVNQILVHTDSLDLEKETDAYYWALGKYLRGIGYQMRQETKLYSGAKPDQFTPVFDVQAATHFFQEALEVFTPDDFPYEWSSTLLRWSAVIEPMLTAEFPDEVRQQLDQQLLASEEVFTPLTHAENWTAIQIHRARLANIVRGSDTEDSQQKPLELLFRAQVFLTQKDHPTLWARLELERARMLAASEDSETRLSASKHYNNCLSVFAPATREWFEVLSELSKLFFSEGQFKEAIPSLEEAVALGEQRFDESFSMHARRVAISAMEGLSRMLSYCYYKTDRWDDAVITLDHGKSRMLHDNLRLSHTDLTVLNAEDRSEAEHLRDQIRLLESETYGGMSDIGHMDQLIKARRDLRGLLSKSQSQITRSADNLMALSNVPADVAIVMPLVSEYGSVVFIVTSGLESMTARHVVPLPSLTSEVVRSWLFEKEVCGWFPAFERRTLDDEGAKYFQDTVARICTLLWDSWVREVCERLRELNVAEIVFVPSGGLQFLPVCAAGPGDNGKIDHRLSDEFRFRSVPSASVLRLLDAGPDRVEAKERAVIAGVTEYEELLPLPNIELEVRAIADRFGIDPLLNEEVTPDVLAQQVSGASFIHLACHGAPWAEDPNFGWSFAPPVVLNLTNGGLSFQDVLRWDLHRSSFVTLSACDTGLVEFDKPWDEFEGLSHVLLQAGARAVIGSLWSVDDESTALLMVRFYENLLQSKSNPAAALGAAQRWLRDSTHASLLNSNLYQPDRWDVAPDSHPFEHPYYWAPFFVTG